MTQANVPPPSPLEDWARGVANGAGELVSVPQPLWLAFALLTGLRVVSAVLWTGGSANTGAGRRAALKRVPAHTTKVLFVVFGLTITGHAVPFLGWLVVASWSVACTVQARMIFHNATAANSDLREAFGDLFEAVARRNLASMSPSPAAPGTPGGTPETLGAPPAAPLDGVPSGVAPLSAPDPGDLGV